MSDSDQDSSVTRGLDTDSVAESYVSEGDAFLAALGASTRGGVDLSFDTTYPIYEDDGESISVHMDDAAAFLRSESDFDEREMGVVDDDDTDDLRMYSGVDNSASTPELMSAINSPACIPTSPGPSRVHSNASGDVRQRTPSRSSKSALSQNSIEPSVFPPSFDWPQAEDSPATSGQAPETTTGHDLDTVSSVDTNVHLELESVSSSYDETDAERMRGLAEHWQLGCVGRTLSRLALARWRFQAHLVERERLSTVVTGAAAAIAYLYLMILRFPMLVRKSDSGRDPLFQLNWKAAFVMSFGIGYTLGKITATFFFSTLRPWQRLRYMGGIACAAFLCTSAFYSLAPVEYEAALLLLGAMPLSALFGIVSQYLEGRMHTEVMVSMLAASLMLGGPISRALAVALDERGVDHKLVPMVLGLMFLPSTLVAMVILDTVPPPTALEAERRSERRPKTLREVWTFVREYFVGFVLIFLGYMMICAFRNYREYFATDIYAKAIRNTQLQSWHYVALECPSTVFVFVAIAVVSRSRSNRIGLLLVQGLVMTGALICIGSTVLYQRGYIESHYYGGIVWIELIVSGTYLMYIPMGFLVFDRLVAAFGVGATAVVLINTADIFGQAASLAVVAYREYIARGSLTHSEDYHQFYLVLIYPLCGTILVINALVFVYFYFKTLQATPKRLHRDRIPAFDSTSLNIQGDDDYQPFEVSGQTASLFIAGSINDENAGRNATTLSRKHSRDATNGGRHIYEDDIEPRPLSTAPTSPLQPLPTSDTPTHGVSPQPSHSSVLAHDGSAMSSMVPSAAVSADNSPRHPPSRWSVGSSRPASREGALHSGTGGTPVPGIVSRSASHGPTTRRRPGSALHLATKSTPSIRSASESGARGDGAAARGMRAVQVSRGNSAPPTGPAHAPRRARSGSGGELGDGDYYQCTECPGRFTRAEAFRIHVRDAHLNMPAWEGEPLQVQMKIFALVDDRRNFTRRVLPAHRPAFDIELFRKCAKASMKEQPDLARMRDECVPSLVSESVFWSNYAYRVNFIVSNFHANDAERALYRHDFKGTATQANKAYGAYVGDILAEAGQGVRVMVLDAIADVRPGDTGTFIASEPMTPPAQVNIDRFDSVRFLHWHQLEILVDQSVPQACSE
eukprot:m.1100847 g.1100847  ORF g.1100847 m.1100847 type:complete len:1138 (-) comp24320_c0_seq2:2984-6397(-)